jgi:hypothetical protein
MDNRQVLNYLAKEIDKLRDENGMFLAAGRAINFDEYRHVCGIIRGLTFAESLVKDLAQKMELSDD